MTESGSFPEGMLHEGKAYKNFTLEEETFGHTLGLINDSTIDAKRMDDPAYNAATLFSRRLTVEGIARITPDAVLGLSGPDGNELIRASITLETRRLQFRQGFETAPADDAGAAEAGVESAGDPADAGGGSQQPA